MKIKIAGKQTYKLPAYGGFFGRWQERCLGLTTKNRVMWDWFFCGVGRLSASNVGMRSN